ncbi:unnamed protein product [Owenia fusiformis]|uniref:Uncharacterized protein n=1 Tax=Owenia fusiformis TaxID=6347 RepID=A0A8J1TWE1_OWEFU|nr:unnamed protein product [Owenia fusiformis]
MDQRTPLILTQILLIFTGFIILISAQTNDQILLQQRRPKISRIKRQGSVCDPNPCFLPPYCENLSICRPDALCKKECICAKGWSGPLCTKAVYTEAPSSVTSSQAEGSESLCKFNPCLGTQCHNYGQCRVNSINCTAICDCPKGFTGSRCETLACDPECKNGRCVLPISSGHLFGEDFGVPSIPKPSCNCYKSWSGAACDEKLNETKCPLTCENGGLCEVINVSVGHSTIYTNQDAYQCKCFNDSYVGDLCEDFCNITCGPNGHCEVLGGVSWCICKTNWSGESCTKYEPLKYPETTPQWYWYVVGTAIGLAVVLLILLFVIPYVMWQKRAIIIMKIRHYFKGYEDDDGKEYDAFISYRSTQRDQNFVVNKMFYTLENIMGFKTCVHFRDFIPGTAIADNIVNAVQTSRRTILILSPDYIKGEWTRLEYQLAQQEMLKLRNRIIPVMLEDILDEKIDENLRYIIESVTYIKYPLGEEDSKAETDFWERIRLAMPKKRPHKDENSDLKTIVDNGIVNPNYDDNVVTKRATNSRTESNSEYDTPMQVMSQL